MRNSIKQQVFDLAGNQLRLWLATLPYLLLERLRSDICAAANWRGPPWGRAACASCKWRRKCG